MQWGQGPRVKVLTSECREELGDASWHRVRVTAPSRGGRGAESADSARPTDSLSRKASA